MWSEWANTVYQTLLYIAEWKGTDPKEDLGSVGWIMLLTTANIVAGWSIAEATSVVNNTSQKYSQYQYQYQYFMKKVLVTACPGPMTTRRIRTRTKNLGEIPTTSPSPRTLITPWARKRDNVLVITSVTRRLASWNWEVGQSTYLPVSRASRYTCGGRSADHVMFDPRVSEISQ